MPLVLQLPATSANLGPGFDAVGLAMRLYLEIEANEAAQFTLSATGRDAARVGSVKRNLMLETYRDLAPQAPALRLQIHNEIPLGMGCGSSAAALLAGVLLANHFGELNLTGAELVAEACRREGHPDNVAACFYGGLTVSSMSAGRVTAASFGSSLPWRLLLALPGKGLATTKARALLPESYSRADTVANIQATALLVAAVALDRPDLLIEGSQDRVHQPYRGEACPLLAQLLPCAGRDGIYSVTLSGAGPSVLLIADPATAIEPLIAAIRRAAGEPLEVVETRICGGYSSTFTPTLSG